MAVINHINIKNFQIIKQVIFQLYVATETSATYRCKKHLSFELIFKI
jgi:hypothetical protein